MLAELKDVIDTYKRKYRRSDLPDLRLSGMYALFPDEEQIADSVFAWNAQWPFSDEAGVYFIFGASGRLLYIGKASMNHCLGNRLSFHFGSDRLKRKCIVVYEGQWTERPMHVATLAVPSDMKFEAAALEEYLIATLDPCDNLMGRVKSIPALE